MSQTVRTDANRAYASCDESKSICISIVIDTIDVDNIKVLKGNPIRKDVNGTFVLRVKKKTPPGTVIGTWNASHTIFIANKDVVDKIYVKDMQIIETLTYPVGGGVTFAQRGDVLVFFGARSERTSVAEEQIRTFSDACGVQIHVFHPS